MRSFGRLYGRRSTVPEGEGVESELSVSDDSDDDGHGSGVHWYGLAEANSDEGW